MCVCLQLPLYILYNIYMCCTNSILRACKVLQIRIYIVQCYSTSMLRLCTEFYSQLRIAISFFPFVTICVEVRSQYVSDLSPPPSRQCSPSVEDSNGRPMQTACDLSVPPASFQCPILQMETHS